MTPTCTRSVEKSGNGVQCAATATAPGPQTAPYVDWQTGRPGSRATARPLHLPV
jgi:hypothetical protein